VQQSEELTVYLSVPPNCGQKAMMDLGIKLRYIINPDSESGGISNLGKRFVSDVIYFTSRPCRVDISHGLYPGSQENQYTSTLTISTTVYTDTGGNTTKFATN
jgi:hypothetical protein